MRHPAPVSPSSDGTSHGPLAIFFDVGDTLVQPRLQYGELLQEIGYEMGIELSPEALQGLAAHMEARIASRARQKLPFTFPAAESQRFWMETYRSYLAGFLDQTKALSLARGVLDLLSSPAGYMVFDDTVATLDQLRSDGFRLGIISNWESWLPDLLEGMGIAHYFDHVVISGMCGLEKPDPGIFKEALDTSGYRPEEILYVGDSMTHDIEPAKMVGIRTVLIDRKNRYHRSSCARIRSLKELDPSTPNR
jgi:putative hydrolase of the HAD superfamily